MGVDVAKTLKLYLRLCTDDMITQIIHNELMFQLKFTKFSALIRFFVICKSDIPVWHNVVVEVFQAFSWNYFIPICVFDLGDDCSLWRGINDS